MAGAEGTTGDRAQPHAATRQPRRMVALYAIAYLGAHLAFMPLLVLLLPRRVEVLAGADAAAMLSWLLLAGASMAAFAHITAGHLSDRWLARHGDRRGLIVLGSLALVLSYFGLAAAQSFGALFAAVVAWQIALNFAFAPLGALLADHFPDRQKGSMGGLMNAALPLANLAVVPVALLFPQDRAMAFIVTGMVCLACFLPLLLHWRFVPILPVAEEASQPAAAPAIPTPATLRRDFTLAWSARLGIQLGAAFVQGYIFLYLLESIAAGDPDPQASASRLLGTLSAPAAVLAIAATLAAGHLSDRMGRRRVPLALAAVLASLGMATLALGDTPLLFLAGYAVFYAGLSAFLSIDTALVAQLVAANPHRGALLGVMNLTNTLPSVIAPVLTLVAFRESAMQQVLGQLFLLSAGLALVSAMAVLFVRSVR